ncbi:hypothetical protein EJ03DRAFT_331865 [Teratosphaeria nubilosa]|uniref:Zn(2)-C6 fungal-type domain-containing protein n=1 Tax=Teratosphaeria nubilosa TaxID=161662 RepID=A0A6G1KUZ1_9PEZI|nr:hypothetical protein EJ03DRAFT_331865 [Teratosphaeria nubilosa]
MTTPPAAGRKASVQDGTPNQHDSDATPATQRQASPKRKASDAATGDHGDGKKKRRKVNHACVYCRRSHMTCDLQRPCARCVKRDIGHLCHDEPREPPRKGRSETGVAEIAPAPEGGKPDRTANGRSGSLQFGQQGSGAMEALNARSSVGSAGQLAQPTPISPTQLQRPSLCTVSSGGSGTINPQFQGLDWNNKGVQNQFHEMHHLHLNYMFNTTEVSNEYNLLNDFLTSSLLDDGAMFGNDNAQELFSDPLLASSSVNALANNLQQASNNSQNTFHLLPKSQLKAGEEISRPSSTFPVSDKARDKFYMTAADPAGLSSAGDRLHKLLKAKYEAGMLKPFNYVKGYRRLQQYMTQHLQPSNQRRILDQLARFRPKFREAMQSLTDVQLVLVEMWFERSLMEYDRVFASMAIPACCWRRTGEIFRGNREMAELIGVPLERLRDGRLAIHEIIIEDSLVSYWEKFGAIAFDQSQKAILTSCSLKTPDPEPGADEEKGKAGEKKKPESVRCCFSFTIRRDTHNIPSLIVGNFIPIRQRPQR